MFDLYQKLKNNSLSQKELEKLYLFCYNISISYLKSLQSDKKIFINALKFDTLENIAVDAIVTLFLDNNEEGIGLTKSLKKWKREISTPQSFDYFLHFVVWRRVDQHLIKLLKETDPFFSKIQDFLNTCISTNDYSKRKFVGKFYIVRNDVKTFSKKLPDIEDVNAIPSEILFYRQVKLLEAIFDFFAENNLSPAIPFTPLIYRIKATYFQDYTYSEAFEANIESGITIKETLSSAKEYIDKVILNTYAKKKKLDDETISIIRKSFSELIKDLKNGGSRGRLIDYATEIDETITSEQFYKEYNGIMQYVFNKLKKHITKELGLS